MTPKYEYITHAQMNGYYADVVRQMTVAEFKPDVVIAIMRGGADMGVKLSNYFDCPMETLSWQTRSGNERELAQLIAIISKYRHNKNILFAEDICDSGKTIAEIRKEVNQRVTVDTDVKFAVAIENVEAGMDCDFASRLINRSSCTQWFVFPWEEWYKSF